MLFVCSARCVKTDRLKLQIHFVIVGRNSLVNPVHKVLHNFPFLTPEKKGSQTISLKQMISVHATPDTSTETRASSGFFLCYLQTLSATNKQSIKLSFVYQQQRKSATELTKRANLIGCSFFKLD